MFALMGITVYELPWDQLVILVNDTRVSRTEHYSYNTTLTTYS